ncbi:hypothetical protein N7G274_002301 [Stereocaulon virgatum]|uniref:Uncharacterized protein n=1 Tax=Stereocaulon virgatum TaxID=373712 RepID=A0ABR4AP74_9LECA
MRDREGQADPIVPRSTNIEINSIYNVNNPGTTLTRAKHEKLDIDLFQTTLSPKKQVLNHPSMSKDNAQVIIPVAGSTRNPQSPIYARNLLHQQESQQEYHLTQSLCLWRTCLSMLQTPYAANFCTYVPLGWWFYLVKEIPASAFLVDVGPPERKERGDTK